LRSCLMPFKRLVMRNFFLRLPLICFLLCLPLVLWAQGQVQMTLVLQPPYSPYFSDYLTYENKGLLTILKPAPGNLDIFLRASITGDNGISGATKHRFKPFAPITLTSTVTTMRGKDFETYFSLGNFDFQGTTAGAIAQGAGFPEGNYTVCLTAFDFNTGAQVSNDACFQLHIVYPEAPLPNLPLCGSEVIANRAQSFSFVWNPSPGAPPTTRYVLKIVELLKDQQPTDALSSSTTPPFFEKEVPITTYTYKLSDPALNKGKMYAWQVTAYDLQKKVMFRNNGVSPACTFTYGFEVKTTNYAYSKVDSLVLLSPACNSATGQDSLIVGGQYHLGATWIWSFMNDTTSIKTAPSKASGTDITGYSVEISPTQQFGFKKFFVVGTLDKSFKTTVPSSKLFLDMDQKQVEAAGLNYNHWYKVIVTALGPGGQVLDSKTSCAVMLVKANEAAASVLFSGSLAYTLEDGGIAYGTPNVSFWAALSKQSTHNTFKQNDQVSSIKVAVKTDSNGKFSFQMPLDEKNRYYRYLDITLVNGYLAQPSRNIPLDSFQNFEKVKGIKRTSGPGGGAINPKVFAKSLEPGDEITVGQQKFDAYTYSLNVRIGKGFPTYYYDTAKGITVYGGDLDTLTINSLVKVKAGLPVIIYRKIKTADILYNEGDNKIIGQIGNIKDGRLIVAQGVTATEKIGPDEHTMVHFKRLLCNRNSINPLDVYYMRVLLPDNAHRMYKGKPFQGRSTGKPSGDNLFSRGVAPDAFVLSAGEEDQDKFLEAPEQMIAFSKLRIPKGQTRGVLDTTYNLISTLPPMSDVSGTLEYAWPASPNVHRPLSNAKFTVKVGYEISGPISGNPNSKCQAVAALMYDENGNPWSPADDGAVMGVGETDAQGKFKIRVVNYDQKGVTTKKGTKELVAMNCGDLNGPPPVAGGFKDPINELKDQWQPYDPMVGIKDYSPITQPGYSDQLGAFQIISDNGVAENWQGNATHTYANTQFNPAGVIVVGAANTQPQGGKPGAPAKKIIKIIESGPAGPDLSDYKAGDENEKPFLPVYRYYYITMENPWREYYVVGQHFTAQAFETINIGTLTAGVQVIQQAAVEVKVNGANNKIIDQAKMVIYRDNGDIPDKMPVGEGTPNHPMKALISESMLKQTEETKEWVIEEGFSIAHKGDTNQFLLNYKNCLLSTKMAKYKMQIAPDPGKTGTRFKAKRQALGYSVNVDLLDAKIVGRVLEAGDNGLGISQASVIIEAKNGKNATPFSVALKTDADGYFEYLKGEKDASNKSINWDDNITDAMLRLTAKMPGYKDTTLSWETAPHMGDQKNYTLTLRPAATITGKIEGEDGFGIDAYIMREDSSSFTVPSPHPYWNAQKKKFEWIAQQFSIPVASGANKTFVIIPKDPAYFDQTINKNIQEGTNSLGEIKMMKRQHRMKFMITRIKADGSAVTGNIPTDQFTITINSKYTASNNANDNMIIFPPFENVSVNNYTVVIEDSKGGNYIPQTVNISNEESTDYTTYYVAMKLGGSISGKVTLNNVAVKGAKVYVEHGAGGGSAYLLTKQSGAWSEMETTSDDAGMYTIHGIPLNEGSIKVHATLDGPGTINGASANVALVNGIGNANFNLLKLTNITLNTIWGFPLTIEDIKQNGTKFTVSGLVDLSINPGAFSWLDNNTKMRIKDILFKTEMINGKDAIVPDAAEVKFVETGLKMRYQNRYNVALATDTISNIASPLTLKKSNVGAVVFAYAHIVDNSYNYPSSYLDFDKTGDFYLAVAANNSINTKIPAITPFKQVGLNYHLCDRSAKPLQFSFIGFNASAEPKNSYIDNFGKIHLDVSFKGNIPNSDPGHVDIHIEDLVLDQNKIEPAQGSEPLVAHLGGGWNLVVDKWTVDPQQGGISSSDATIQTGIADIKMANFNLRANKFVLDGFQPQNITLGNGTMPLENVSPYAALVFDHKIGSDGGAHWRFNIAPDGNAPAAVFYLDGALKQQKLELEYIQLIAYNKENIITLGKTEVPFFNNPKVKFIPTTISSSDGMFILKGDASFPDIPRTSTVGLSMLFQKSGNTLKRTLSPFKFNFDGKGYVQYLHKPTDSMVIDENNGLMTLHGSVMEPGKTDPIPCSFTFGSGNNGEIKLRKGYMLTLTPGTQLELGESIKPDNGMYVEGDDWSTLKFSGLLKGGGGTLGPANKLNFEVLGEITANADSLKATDIDSGFGNLNMVYDLPTSTMHGSMHMNNMAFGTWEFTGDVEVLFGKDGFLSMASGQLNTGILFADGFGVFTAGLLLGSYPLNKTIIDKTIQFSKNPQASCWLTGNMTNFKGFYFTGGYDVLNESEGFDIGIASVYYNAVLGIEASLGLNFAQSQSLLGLGAHGKVTAGASAITGTTIEGEIEAHVSAELSYGKGSGFGVDGMAALGVGFKVCQHVPVVDEELCWGESAEAAAKFGFGSNKDSYFDFSLEKGASSTCVQKAP
jgi:hypothetical protein